MLIAGMVCLLAVACSNINTENSLYENEVRPDLDIKEMCPRHKQDMVSTSAVIWVQFNKPLKPETVHEGTVLLGNGRWHVKGDVYYHDRIMTYVPIEELDPNCEYDLYITSSLRDEDGFALTTNAVAFYFTTGDPGVITCRQ